MIVFLTYNWRTKPQQLFPLNLLSGGGSSKHSSVMISDIYYCITSCVKIFVLYETVVFESTGTTRTTLIIIEDR